MNLDTTYRVLRPHVIFENVEGELILVHLQKGCYFSVDAVGAEVWSLIDNGHTLGQIVESVRFRYDAPADQIRAGVGAFVQRLLDEELVATDESTSPANVAAAAPSSTRPVFQAPSLEKYTDMRDMLALDPVHDVEAAGWPVPKVEDEAWPSPDDATGSS